MEFKIQSTAHDGGVLSLEYPSMRSRLYGALRPVACEELKVYKGTSNEELKGLQNECRIVRHFLIISSTHYFLPLFPIPFLLMHCTVAIFLVTDYMLPIFCFIYPKSLALCSFCTCSFDWTSCRVCKVIYMSAVDRPLFWQCLCFIILNLFVRIPEKNN